LIQGICRSLPDIARTRIEPAFGLRQRVLQDAAGRGTLGACERIQEFLRVEHAVLLG
jgi:hypothetical protein